MLDQATLEKLIKSGKLVSPLYVFAGPEAFLKEKAFSMIANKLVPKDDQAENIFRISTNGKDLPGILNQIFSFSFNPSPRVFFIQELDSAAAKQRKDFLEKLHQNGIPPATIIIFPVSDSRIATDIATKFKQQSEKIDFWAPFANQLGAWVKRETAEFGAEISSEAADLLVELAGSDLSLLHQELEKLAIGAAGGKIGLAEVKNGVAYLRQDNIFDFLDAFGRRSLVKTIRCMESLINRGEAPQKIWFMLCKQLRDFRLFHEISIDRPDIFEPVLNLLRKYKQHANKSDFKANQEKKNITGEIQRLADEMPENLATAAGLRHAGKLRNLHMALNFSYSELLRAWPAMIETDLKLKSGAPDPGAALQSFVAAMLSD
ncbi:MAG: DNA polymerase III subunit delta [Erysipelotrichia bacterium]|nr:DNA polymerase III subunit delta [Erysipelotrichia bacterium]